MSNNLFQSCLLIEDDPAHAHLVKRALRESCGEVIHADSMDSAIKALKERRPELIFYTMESPPEIAYGEGGRGHYQNQAKATEAYTEKFFPRLNAK